MYIYFNHCYKQVEKTQSDDNHDKTQQKRFNKKKNLHHWTAHRTNATVMQVKQCPTKKAK